MLKQCARCKCVDVILKFGWEFHVLASVTQGSQYICAQFLDMLLEYLQLVGVLFAFL